ncbi:MULTISPECIES: methylmalonyl Co-A mutase-associated GTPase MeaB [Roseiflexus]|uniref:LAO/AO transport system ATPase n=1 Tax=Roseiflexus castenholzii (strain DSM 13941 / HLO8) TaxID=383372 RepID=A7NNC3_ROSCS|nr:MULTISPECIES: methylmalonyl Co-A mutase-associated GTPase MeaB [Roseiflexus]ABU59056.1 LAO/AO transport system ATPase [Roseiflexus castenholzii DSM 13941]GIW02103.1 MAG: GTPase [Roseiflexus sp.]
MDLVQALLSGHRRALAQALTLVETGGPQARALLGALFAHTGRAHIIGVTGAPGAGKSTLVTALAAHWRRTGRTVGIIAVDPTSPFTRGALLGDRIRMQALSGDPGVFIRSMASRGRLGGIARATGDAVALLDAAGFDLVLIETVGAGQGEVEIAAAAHTTIVIEIPGAGDDIQAIKAGILEIADVLVVNKADRDGAEQTVRQLRAMLSLADLPVDGWTPPVLTAVAMRGEGIEAIATAAERHLAYLRESERLTRREQERAERELRLILQETALERVRAHVAPSDWEALIAQIVARALDPYTAANRLLERVLPQSGG